MVAFMALTRRRAFCPIGGRVPLFCAHSFVFVSVSVFHVNRMQPVVKGRAPIWNELARLDAEALRA